MIKMTEEEAIRMLNDWYPKNGMLEIHVESQLGEAIKLAIDSLSHEPKKVSVDNIEQFLVDFCMSNTGVPNFPKHGVEFVDLIKHFCIKYKLIEESPKEKEWIWVHETDMYTSRSKKHLTEAEHRGSWLTGDWKKDETTERVRQ